MLILLFNMCISLLMNNLFWPDKSTSYLYFLQVSLSTPNLLEVLLSRKLDDDCGTSWECLLYLDILIWNTVCQHYCSILMTLLDRRLLTLFVTESLASNASLIQLTHLYTSLHCYLFPKVYSKGKKLLDWDLSGWYSVTTRLCKFSCFNQVTLPLTK